MKLLATPYGGSICEAITTSLPTIAGGSRTWDYRYSWIRDGALTIQALANIGHRAEASAYFEWLSEILIRDGAESLQAVYTLDGGKSLQEREIESLSGYQGSRPVRVGNQSAQQFHLDIYGDIMLAASEHFRIFGALPERLWPCLMGIADYVCQAWRRPDHGHWEVRSRPEHFVASKLMCWAALDRAIGLAQARGKAVSPRWVDERLILHRTICDQGYDETKASFIRSFGDSSLDAAALLIPLLGFLPFDDPRVQGTLDAIQSRLSQGTLLKRYESDDGIEGGEGAHLVSSFLFVSCLALAGRTDEASDRLAELCTYSTPLGLFGEQIDPSSGETTGNFPSAAVHLSLINAALYVGLARGRNPALRSAIGMPEPAPLMKRGASA